MAWENQNSINAAILQDKECQSICLLLLLKVAEDAFQKNNKFLHLQIIILLKSFMCSLIYFPSRGFLGL